MAEPYEVVDFSQLPGVACPCGTARRAFYEAADFPATVHLTEISSTARLHYHRHMLEVYYILECAADAQMQLNSELLPLQPGLAILIRPGTRHRAVGVMKVLLIAYPKFDPHDEWFDEE
jgi:mannose-6-phosphate isomerase-like protein (cupin superfamily)